MHLNLRLPKECAQMQERLTVARVMQVGAGEGLL